MDDLVRLSGAARQVWAKGWRQRSGLPGDEAGQPTRAWLPLWQHLHDAAGVVGRLWDAWLPPIVKDQIAQAAGGDDAARVLLCFLAGVHDVGKTSPAFAVQVDVLRDEMVTAGLPMAQALPGRGRLPHGLAGQVILERWLEAEHGWSVPEARSLASVVGAHHGIPPSDIEARDARTWTTTSTELMGDGPWRAVQDEFVAHMVELTGAAPHLAGARWRALPRPVLALALAVVVVADWLASNEDLFPLVPVGDERPLAQPDGDDERRLAQAWAGVNLPRPWTPAQVQMTADELLRTRFDLPEDAQARPVQRAAVEAARAMDPPGILVIEAPMGEGKTEAAMLAAEVLAARAGAGGVMVALPTQATSDAMFGRVMRWIACQPCTLAGADVVDGDGGRGEEPDERRAVFLAHGKAWLNPDYAAVPRARLPVRDVGRDEPHRRGTDGGTGGAYVDGWMRGRRKGILADFVVGTIDQVLFAALKSRHVALRHLAMARKVVILDEIHSFDAYMNVYLERALEWLGAYGVPVVALSATLPPALRARLVGAYRRGREAALAASAPAVALPSRRRRVRLADRASGADPAAATSAAPPQEESGAPEPPSSVLTFLSGGELREVVPAPTARRLRVQVETAADVDVPALLATALAEGGCAMVVRNTVARAQQTYRELVDAFSDDRRTRVVLLHSRFLANDRKRREADVVRMLGAPDESGADPAGRDRLIVVGTQVVEQSLDIDVDLLVTDLAPTDLLLQRIGRLHRHAARTPDRRPAPLREARAVIVGVEDWAVSPPTPVKGSRYVYRDYLPLRAAAQVLALRDGAGRIELPRDIAPLVTTAYGSDDLGPADWQDAVDRARRREKEHREVQERKAETFRLPRPDADLLGLSGWLDGSAGEADVAGARAQVRDAEDGIEVIVVQSNAAGQWRIPDWVDEPRSGRFLDRRQIPPLDQRQVLAASTVRLPTAVGGGRRGDAVIDRLEQLGEELDLMAWQRSPDLTGQLVLPFDDDRRATLPGCVLTYDPDTGLEVEYL